MLLKTVYPSKWYEAGRLPAVKLYAGPAPGSGDCFTKIFCIAMIKFVPALATRLLCAMPCTRTQTSSRPASYTLSPGLGFVHPYTLKVRLTLLLLSNFRQQLLALSVFLFLSAAASAQCVLTGQVADETGQPLAGANVLLLETKQGDATGEDGTYRISGLEPGDYTLRLTYIGYETATRKIAVAKGQNLLELDLRLQPRAVQVDELIVRATRAGEKAPMTYTNLDAETIEKSNLGQDVPFLLRSILAAPLSYAIVVVIFLLQDLIVYVGFTAGIGALYGTLAPLQAHALAVLVVSLAVVFAMVATSSVLGRFYRGHALLLAWD